MADNDTIPSSSSGGVLKAGDNDVPALILNEKGFVGLNVLGGQILEECQDELRFPESIKTFQKMAKDGTIAPALELIEMMIARVPWFVSIPEGYEEELKDKAQFVTQCMHDMEHSWSSFIKQVVSYNRYGFCINEKVYRRRRKDKGSKYDDNLIGIRKLPIRSQDTIKDFIFKNQGRDLAGITQSVILPTNSFSNYSSFTSSTFNLQEKRIPRNKFLLFRNNPLKDSPLGAKRRAEYKPL